MRGRAQDPDPPTRVLDDRQHIQACAGQGDGLEEIARKQGIGLGAEKAGLERRSGSRQAASL
jgi:hypothetical protein